MHFLWIIKKHRMRRNNSKHHSSWIKLSSLRIWSLIICTISWPRENNKTVQCQQGGGWMLKWDSWIVLVVPSAWHYVPKYFCFSSLAFLQKRTNNCCFGFWTLVIEHTDLHRKHCWNEGEEYAAQFISKKTWLCW